MPTLVPTSIVPSRIQEADATIAEEIRLELTTISSLFADVQDMVGDDNTYTAAGAIAVTDYVARIDGSTAGATFALTLAAPGTNDVGRMLTITMVDATDSATLANTNMVGGGAGTTYTFDAVGETLVLVGGSNSKWIVLKEQGVTVA